jgi:tRNA-dihydrouridine synthase 2
MVARAAEWNPSVFRQEGPLPVIDVVKRFLQYVREFAGSMMGIFNGHAFQCVEYDNSANNTKFCAQQMLHEELEKSYGKQLLSATTVRQMWSVYFVLFFSSHFCNSSKIFNLAEFYDKTIADRADREDAMALKPAFKRRKLEEKKRAKYTDHI